MGKLAKARELSGGEWLLLLKVFALLPVVRLGGKLLPFRILASLFRGKQSLDGQGPPKGTPGPDRLAYLVEVASRHHLLKPTCLEKALVFYGILRRKHVEADLRIGTTKREGRFEAHAWVEHRGQVLLGGPVEHYARLLPLETDRSQGQLA